MLVSRSAAASELLRWPASIEASVIRVGGSGSGHPARAAMLVPSRTGRKFRIMLGTRSIEPHDGCRRRAARCGRCRGIAELAVLVVTPTLHRVVREDGARMLFTSGDGLGRGREGHRRAGRKWLVHG